MVQQLDPALVLRHTKPIEVISQVGRDEFGQLFDPGDVEGVFFDSVAGISISTPKS